MGRLETLPPAPEPEAAPPQVFVRTFMTPTGLPWDQARAAELEARHGAPLPISELAHQLRRLENWAPARQGRYAVFYVRRRDFTQPFETTLEVDGAAIRVAFGRRRPNARQFRHLQGLALGGVCAALTLAVSGAAVVQAFAARTAAEAQLERLERQAAAKLRLAERLQADRVTRRALAVAQGATGAPEQVLRDLGWLTRARTADARIVAVHWDSGLMALEARGKGPPVTSVDRQLVRGQRPTRDGVWLWGVAPVAAPEGPLASELFAP